MRTGEYPTVHRALRSGACALLIVWFSGCALQRYEPAPLDPAATARAYDARTLDAPGLKDYFVAHGRPAAEWPVQRWGLDDLTLLAFYSHPDLELARAQAKAARAEVAAATQRPPIGITPRVQHHSLTTSEQSSPWSLGFDVEIPLSGGTRREATEARYSYLADAADLQVGSVAWGIRADVRVKLLDQYLAERTVALLTAEAEQRRRLLGLLERRLDAGAISRVEVGNARLAQSEIAAQAEAAKIARVRSRAALAQALGLPLTVVQTMTFDFAAFDETPEPSGDTTGQRTALLNRLDIRAKLLDYSAADASVKLEIARQYPTVSISPGYLWDQSDNIWSIAATVLLPAGGNKSAIGAAQARREVAAREFLSLQSHVIAEADGAQARYRQARDGATSLQEVLRLSAARERATQKQFDAGYADRVELTLAQLATLTAERDALSVSAETQRSLGALEDALQMPLAGGPLPRWSNDDKRPAPGLAAQ
jgi:outer membrane protein TolC